MSFIKQLLKNLRKVYSYFRDNTCGVYLADMQSLSKYNKGIRYLLCAIDLFSKYVWVVLIEMYSTYIEGNSVVVEKFIRTLKNKIFRHMTAISKNVYFDVLDDIVNKYNNTVHKTIKMKPIDVRNDSYAEYNENSNKKGPKFKVDDCVRIQNTKTFLLKDILQIGQKRFLVLIKIKNTVPWTYVVSDLNGKKIIGSFYEK